MALRLRLASNSFLAWKAFVLISIVVLFIPIVSLVTNISIDTTSYWQHIKDKLLTEYILNTLILIVGTSTLTVCMGGFSAWLVVYNDFKLRRFFEIAFVIPIAIPIYIQAYTYAGLFEYGGFIERVFSFCSLGTVNFHIDIMNIGGLIFMYSTVLYPYVYLLVRSSFMLQSNDMHNVSASLNKSNLVTFFRVTLPLSWPALFGALILVIVEVLNDYGAVKYYGVNTFVVGIFQSWFSMGDIGSALYLSLILSLFIIIILVLEVVIKRRKRYHSKLDELATDRKPEKLTKKKCVFVQFLAVIIVLFSLILPVYQLVYWFVLNYEVVLRESFIVVLFNSFTVAFIVSAFVVFMTLLLVFAVSVINKMKYRSITKLSLIGYTLPGAILAIGIILFFYFLSEYFGIEILTSGYLFGGSMIVLAFAYFIRFYGVAYNTLMSGNDKISNQYIQSAFILGKRAKSVLFQVYLPLARPAIISALLFVFVDVIKELPLILILRPFNFDTLSTMAYQSASDELVDKSAVYALCIIIISLIPTILLNKVIRRVK